MEATLTLYDIAGSSTLDIKFGLVEDLRDAAVVGGFPVSLEGPG